MEDYYGKRKEFEICIGEAVYQQGGHHLPSCDLHYFVFGVFSRSDKGQQDDRLFFDFAALDLIQEYWRS